MAATYVTRFTFVGLTVHDVWLTQKALFTDSPQSISSDPSAHCSRPSHILLSGRHAPSPHSYSLKSHTEADMEESKG